MRLNWLAGLPTVFRPAHTANLKMNSRRLAAAIALVALAAAASGQRTEEFRALAGHVPAWASDDTFVAALADDEKLPPMTLVLARHADREQAFEKLLADQLDPASPEFHHWQDSSQIGERFGLDDDEIAALTGWLESQGLHVDWVAPAKNFIGFSGRAGDIGRAFQTELAYYDVGGERMYSIDTPPMLPSDLASLVQAVHGLSEVRAHPAHQARGMRSDRPDATFNGTHYTTPSDFATIYNVPSSLNGEGFTIGIVGRARVDPADLTYFNSTLNVHIAPPTEVVPTAYGGVDPGPPITSPPTGNVSTDDQGEATLDVTRSASIAGKAKILLVVNKSNQDGGTDIGGDMQYLAQSKPVPAQIVNISFITCEYEGGSGAVSYWDALFKQAAGEGISVFVSSGDAGAAECDAFFATPPSNPDPISPNAICASSYATCVGGTEFNDSTKTSEYWSNSNGAGFSSALRYIPEGGWNDPLVNGNPDEPVAESSGGGVSKYMPTPSWQMGPGVPSKRAGRYTPDIAFSASFHDGYFTCFAANGWGCVPNSQGEFSFAVYAGTSAAAPDTAGIVALLDQKYADKQGNLNPRLYPYAALEPGATAFHDVTVSTSGVSGCKVSVPSMCNNSIPSATGLTGGEEGYLVGPGYDEVTGLGSLNVANFIDHWNEAGKMPAITTGAAASISASGATLKATVDPHGISTHYWFVYAPNSTFTGAAKTAVTNAGNGSASLAVSAKVSGLKKGTKYYFRIEAEDAYSTLNGKTGSFTTAE